MRQSDGRTAVSNDRWKMSLSAGARVSAQFFKMTFGIWSGPHALWGLMALSNLHTPAVLMLISLIIVCCGGSRCGGADPPSLVKTLWNWSRRISVFSLLSHTSEPFFFGGGGGGYSNVVLFSAFNVFPEGFGVVCLESFMHTSPTCFLDEFVVCPVVCFLSFLIESSLSLYL